MYKVMCSLDCNCDNNIPVVELVTPEFKKLKIGFYGCPHCECAGFIVRDYGSSEVEKFEAVAVNTELHPFEVMVQRCWFPVPEIKSVKV